MISLVVGLGNITEKYQGTRHNVGFEVLDRVVKRLKVDKVKTTDLYDYCKIDHQEGQSTLVWPRTYMNRSGWAVEELLERYELLPENMLVIVDDFSLPLGKIRIRKSGSNGGHNGLESIIETIETSNFPRLRLGIGSVPDNISSPDFVLSRFEPGELELVEEMLDKSAEAVLFSINNRFDEVMNKFNVNPA
jgi:peptidyl-tRNA hydrolase, PTH1 family